MQAWEEILSKEKASSDQEKSAAVQRVGLAVSSVVDEPGFQWEFRLFADDQANAFCLPGGKVGVYEGIFEYVENDAQLATVIAHEIAHATARHGGERMTQAMVANLGALGLALAIKEKKEEERVRWMAAYTGITTLGFILPYSRKHEYAADKIGLVYMAQAGYEPTAALEFWSEFARKQGARLPELLSTHPVNANRIEALRQQMSMARFEYDGAAVKRGTGQTYQTGM